MIQSETKNAYNQKARDSKKRKFYKKTKTGSSILAQKNKCFSNQDILFFGINANTLHRIFRGTHASLIALFSLFELLHNIQNLVYVADGKKSDEWVISWYDNQLECAEQKGLYFRPEVKKYIKKWYMPEKTWKKILEDAKNEYLIMLQERKITKTIVKLLEKAKSNNKC